MYKLSGKIEDVLLIHIMYSLRLRTEEIRLLKFEALNDQDLPTTKVDKSQRRNKKMMRITQSLAEEIKNYKSISINKGKYNKTIR